MTNIIVEKNEAPLAELPNTPDVNNRKRRLGMAKAGEEINDWMMSNQEPLAEEFFDDLFDELDGGGANGYRLKVEADDAGGNPSNWRIRSRKRGYRFRTDVARYKLAVDCVNEESTWVGRQVNMTIGVPEQRGNLLAGGYLGRLFDDIKGLIEDEGRDDLAKQYLLAAIFLNRCQ